MWHLTLDMLHTEVLNILIKLQVLRFGSEDVLKIFSQRITNSVNEWMSDNGVCRADQARQGMLNSDIKWINQSCEVHFKYYGQYIYL